VLADYGGKDLRKRNNIIHGKLHIFCIKLMNCLNVPQVSHLLLPYANTHNFHPCDVNKTTKVKVLILVVLVLIQDQDQNHEIWS